MTEVVLASLAVTVLLLLVSLITPLANRVSVPQTVMLAGLGIVLGLGVVSFGQAAGLGILGDVLRGFGTLGLGADAFLILFLPPLLFAAGLCIDVRLLLDELPAVLLLAVVAVLVCAAAVGYALAAITEIGLVACLLLGAIVAATDPAAVIGIFRDIGAPRRLSILVAGESLFNDAAAIALFTILIGVLGGGDKLDVGRGVTIFLLDFAGGVALGYVLARLACSLLVGWQNALAAEITLTVGLAYLTYILGDSYLEVSGVVAVVTAALTFAVHGRTKLSPDTWTTLLQTWAQLEFWANSLIFVLAAMLATRMLPELGLRNAGLLLVLLLAALAARAAVLYVLLPALSLSGLVQPVGPRHKAVILWGGVRGAVTLVLALSVSQNPALSREVQHLVSTLAIGFALITLFLGASTLKPFIHLLGLDRLSPTEAALRDRVMALSHATVGRQIEAVSRDYGFDPALAARLTPRADEAAAPRDGEAAMPLSAEQRMAVGLLTLANRERELLIEDFRLGTISRRMVADLLAAADRRLDRVKLEGPAGYDAATATEIKPTAGLRAALWLHREFGWSRPLARSLADQFETLLIFQLVVRELERFNQESVQPLLGAGTAGSLAALLSARRDTVEGALTAVGIQYPDYVAALRAQYLARAALRFEDAEYRRKFEESLIPREVYADLQRDLRQRRQQLERQPPLEVGPGVLQMVARVAVFEGLDPPRLMEVARLLRPSLATPGEVIVRRGAPGARMYFIASGSVEVRLPAAPVDLGTGEFFGELALLTRRPRMADVAARTYCHLLVLERRDFRRLLGRIPDLQRRIETIAEQRLAQARDRERD